MLATVGLHRDEKGQHGGVGPGFDSRFCLDCVSGGSLRFLQLSPTDMMSGGLEIKLNACP